MATPTSTTDTAAVPDAQAGAGSPSVAAPADDGGQEGDHLVEELLVEEVSIDGMCGVY